MTTYNDSIPGGSAVPQTTYAPSVTLPSPTNPYSATHITSVDDSIPQPLDLTVYGKGFIHPGGSQALNLVVSWEGSLEDGFAIGCHIGAGRDFKEEGGTEVFSNIIKKILREGGSRKLIENSCCLASLRFLGPPKSRIKHSPSSLAASDIATTIKALYKRGNHPELHTEPVFRGFGGALAVASSGPPMSLTLDDASCSGNLQYQSTSMNKGTTLFRYATQNAFLEGHMRQVASNSDYALWSLPCSLKWRCGDDKITLFDGNPNAMAKHENSVAGRATNANRSGYQPNKVSSQPTSPLTSAHSNQVATPAPQGHQMSDMATSTQISDDANTFGGPLNASPLDAPAGLDTNATGRSASLSSTRLHSRTPSSYDLCADGSYRPLYGNSPNPSISARDQCAPLSENWGPEQVNEYVRQVALMGKNSKFDQQQSSSGLYPNAPDTQPASTRGSPATEIMPTAMRDSGSEQEMQRYYDQPAQFTGIGGPADLHGEQPQADLATPWPAPTAVQEHPTYMLSLQNPYQQPQTPNPYDDFVTRAIPPIPTGQYLGTLEDPQIGSTLLEEPAAITPRMSAAMANWQKYATAYAAPYYGEISLLSPNTVTDRPFDMQADASFVSPTLSSTVNPTVHPDGSLFLQPPQPPTTYYDSGSFDAAPTLAYGHSPPLNRHPPEQNQTLLPIYPDTMYPSLQDQEAATGDPSSQTPPSVVRASHALMTPLARAHRLGWPDGKGQPRSKPRRPRRITGEVGRKDWERRDG